MSTAVATRNTFFANPIFLTDSYKLAHRDMYPEGTWHIYSNFTPRTSRIEGIDKVVFFGLQAFLTRVLGDMFDAWFAEDVETVVAEYERRVTRFLGLDSVDSSHIRALHQLGYLPLRFNALPEGTETPLQVPVFTVENTNPEFFWLTNYIESVLSAEIWMASTNATLALRLRRLLDGWAEKTSDNPFAVNFQGHDFSFRGMASHESAAASGAGHLLSFSGTDTLPALDWIERYYPVENDAILGMSVPATEHSVMCAGGMEDEQGTFERLLDIYPTGILSVVSDTWDLWAVCTEYLPNLKDRIMGRENGKLVIRPDSGNPVDILCGTLNAHDGITYDLRTATNPGDWTTAQVVEDRRNAEQKGVIELLWDTFGGTINSKGYKELDPHIGAIYGDSITFERADEICKRLEAKGFASTNVVFGVGSFSYQYQTRDVFGFAMKATWSEVLGEGRDLFKDPATDNGGKRSAKGRLAVTLDDDGELSLIQQATPEQEAASLLTTVWEDGQFVQQHTWNEVVARVGVRTF